MGLGDVGNLEAADAMRTIPVERPEVEYMLDILHRVDMAVDIDIVVMGGDGADQLGLIAHLDAATLVDGTFLVFDNPVVDGAIVNAEDVCWLAALGIDHGPDGASVAVDLTILPYSTEITRGELAHG